MTATSTLSLRISPKDRALIDRAAESQSKSRTEFMLDAARIAATDELLDKRLFFLDETEFATFERALADAPKAADIIKKLEMRPSPWKK
jgi:uncharacterized protein (DUF1778 family)